MTRALPTRVLLVDDVESLRYLYRRIFKREAPERYEVVAEAGDGQEAIRLAKEHQPDLVLLDVSMPVMDGMEALPHIVRASPAAKVVMLSGFSADRLGKMALERGAAHYLEKGVTPKDLVRELDRVLGRDGAAEAPPAQDGLPIPADAFQRRLADLEATNRELEAFSYTVSHDLRAPLRGIGYLAAALAEDATELTPEHRELTRLIRDESDRLGRLVEDLLTLSRASRGELQRERIDLSEHARQALQRFAKQEPARRVDTLVEDGLVVEGDADLLGNALENLLSNAWKFTRHAPAARIEVGRAPTPEGVAFFVRDNGVGFDAANAHGLFEPFRRLHSPKEFAGTGIGLASVKRIVHRHGGRIWVESRPGEGATFYFTLPRTGDVQTENARTPSSN